MVKIDFKKVKLDRIEQIKIDMGKSRRCRSWTRFYKLKSELERLEESLR